MANPSQVKFPANREITGKFCHFDLVIANLAIIYGLFSVPYDQIPYFFEQGILGAEQGRCGRRSGMPGTQTGKWQSAESFTSKNPDTPHVV